MHTEAVLQCVTSSGVPGPEHFLVRYKPMPAGPAVSASAPGGQPPHSTQPPAAASPFLPGLRFHGTQPGLARQQLPLRSVPRFPGPKLSTGSPVSLPCTP